MSLATEYLEKAFKEKGKGLPESEKTLPANPQAKNQKGAEKRMGEKTPLDKKNKEDESKLTEAGTSKVKIKTVK